MPSESMPTDVDMSAMPNEGSFPGMGQMPGFPSGEQGGEFQRPGNMGDFDATISESMNNANGSVTGNNGEILLAVSLIVLALGLVIAYFFKPRSW